MREILLYKNNCKGHGSIRESATRLTVLFSVPEFRYWLWGASGYSDEQIKGQVILKVTLMLFKHVLDNNLKDTGCRIFRRPLGIGLNITCSSGSLHDKKNQVKIHLFLDGHQRSL